MIIIRSRHANSKFDLRFQVGAEKQTASVDSRVKDIVWPSPDDEIVFWNKEFPHWDVSQQAPAEIEKDSDLMHIIHVTAEMAPIAKVGGLGDVVTGLARACLSRAHKVDIMLPFYECIQREQISELELITTYESYYDGNWVPTNAYRGVVSGIPVIFIQPSNYFFKGQYVYGGSYKELEAYLEAQVYLLVHKQAITSEQVTGTQPDIIHIHEWQTGSLPLLYWDMYHYLSLKKPRIVLTIHNMEHYGECCKEELSKCGLDGSIYATLDKDGALDFQMNVAGLKGMEKDECERALKKEVFENKLEEFKDQTSHLVASSMNFFNVQAVDDRTIGHNPERLSLLKGGIVYSNVVTKTKASLELERFPYQSGDFLEYLTLTMMDIMWCLEWHLKIWLASTVSPTYLKETLCSGWLASTLILNRDK
ncbi:putative starch synthase 4, chloroplastic/amyloplastic [Vitis vinifera]|uniref:starch synthase n=1 Tax=Vitis vinifera TaxID=29760 RepID=A0A438BT85_VITVI|nr:putative starch synthase 4, chloroplastic/amyloplastic [Vitis vinifera]